MLNTGRGFPFALALAAVVPTMDVKIKVNDADSNLPVSVPSGAKATGGAGFGLICMGDTVGASG